MLIAYRNCDLKGRANIFYHEQTKINKWFGPTVSILIIRSYTATDGRGLAASAELVLTVARVA
jgi:hypothetical protein